jgi:hypothetical protein
MLKNVKMKVLLVNGALESFESMERLGLGWGGLECIELDI